LGKLNATHDLLLIAKKGKTMSTDAANLTVSQVAEIAGCHRNTVLNYTRRGHLKALHNVNNVRYYSKQDALKLKQLIEIRKPE
jgi:hypothetical protein